MDEFWEHGPPTRTAGIGHILKCHWHQVGRFHWKRIVLGALCIADEFFCGRFVRLCLLRTKLESRWWDYC